MKLLSAIIAYSALSIIASSLLGFLLHSIYRKFLSSPQEHRFHITLRNIRGF